ncbi:MAG TPA: PDZ domain-containing protein [Planctomycetota bacterium]|nr:PDZ domain-containing protein [Planctomycetota bacterium]
MLALGTAARVGAAATLVGVALLLGCRAADPAVARLRCRLGQVTAAIPVPDAATVWRSSMLVALEKRGLHVDESGDAQVVLDLDVQQTGQMMTATLHAALSNGSSLPPIVWTNRVTLTSEDKAQGWDAKLSAAVTLELAARLQKALRGVAHDLETSPPTTGRGGDPAAALEPQDSEPSGLYAAEAQLTFNVLDAVSLDPASGKIGLFGHRDDSYIGNAIPWLEHLAELLDHPSPEFSLSWTPDSAQRVQAFLDKTESPEEIRRVTDQWGAIIGPNRTLSPMGSVMLPILGLRVTDAAAPGFLGLDTKDVDGGVRVDRVYPGSPAEKVGLLPGDVITRFGGPRVFDSRHFVHTIRAAGAGATLSLTVWRKDRGVFAVQPTLGVFQGDAFAGMTGNDVAACIFASAGMKKAAGATHWCDIVFRYQKTNKDYTDDAILGLLGALGLGQEVMDLWGKGGDAPLRISRDMCAALDDAYGLEGHPVLAAFDANYDGQDIQHGLDPAWTVLDQQTKPALGRALASLMSKPGGMQIPPELMEATYHLHPEVQPEYLGGLDPRSQLARVMFEADYVGKRLVHSPWLATVVPGYQTVFEFDRAHPGSRHAGATRTYHMWISCAALDAAETGDGRELQFRGARMQFNIRQRDQQGMDLPPMPGGYEDLLTQRYEALSRLVPVLHEVRECEKLAAAARWIQSKRPGTVLPREGRTTWAGPSRMPGLVYLYLYPPTGPSRFDETVIATGGCSLRGLSAFPKDTGLHDLSDAVADFPSITLIDPPPVHATPVGPATKTPSSPTAPPSGGSSPPSGGSSPPPPPPATGRPQNTSPSEPPPPENPPSTAPTDPQGTVKPPPVVPTPKPRDLLFTVLPAVPGKREGIMINPAAENVKDPARVNDLAKLMEVTRLMLIAKNAIELKLKDEDIQKQKQAELWKALNDLKKTYGMLVVAKGGFREQAPSIREDLKNLWGEIKGYDIPTDLLDPNADHSARARIESAWEKLKEDSDLGARFHKWIEHQKELWTENKEAERIENEIYQDARVASNDRAAMQRLQEHYDALAVYRDQLLRKLNMIE